MLIPLLMLIRYGGLIANYHRGFTPDTKLVIWLHGAPGLPKESDDKDVVSFLANGFDFISPDYYGSHCCDGEFQPATCIDTAIDTYRLFEQGGIVLHAKSGEEIKVLPYEEIVIMGASFGAWFASRIHQYLPQCKTIGLCYPFLETNNRAQGEYVGEMTNEEDFLPFEIGGQKHLYRGRGSEEWNLFFQDQRGQSYENMLQDLSQKQVFIAHGALDNCVHVARSRKLHKELYTLNPDGNHFYLEIPQGGHGGITKQIATVEFCKWLNGL